MADPYPSFPAKTYWVSRVLRLVLFSFVVATLFVSAFVVVFRWVWDSFLAGPLNRDPYAVRPELLVPAILVIAVVLAMRLWDSARVGPRKGERPPA